MSVPADVDLSKESYWHSELENFQRAWSASSLKTFQECPRKYEYLYVRGLTRDHEPSYFAFGKIFHASLEAYDLAIFEGKSFEVAVDTAVRAAVQQGKVLGNAFLRGEGDDIRNQFTLARAVSWYIEHWKDDGWKTFEAGGQPALETEFRIELGIDDIVLVGFMDRIAELPDGTPVIHERKTTTSTLATYFRQYALSHQVNFYLLASQLYFPGVDTIWLDATYCTKTANQYARHPETRDDDALQTWIEDVHQWLTMAKHYAKQEYWPQNFNSCSRCQFASVCAAPAKERNDLLSIDYVVKRRQFVGERKTEEGAPNVESA